MSKSFKIGDAVWAPGHGPSEVLSKELTWVMGGLREYVTVETAKGAVVYDARALKPTDELVRKKCECCGGTGYLSPSPHP